MFKSPALSKLCDEVIYERVIEKICAKDQATLDSWQKNDAIYANEGFFIRDFNPSDDQLLSAAILEWEKRESCLLTALKMDGDNFDRWFQVAVRQFHQGLEDRPWGTTLGRALGFSREIVTNIEWVRAFVFFLPKYAQHRKNEITKCGLRMAEIFYLERMEKSFDYKKQNDHDFFANIHAYWDFSLKQNEFNTKNRLITNTQTSPKHPTNQDRPMQITFNSDFNNRTLLDIFNSHNLKTELIVCYEAVPSLGLNEDSYIKVSYPEDHEVILWVKPEQGLIRLRSVIFDKKQIKHIDIQSRKAGDPVNWDETISIINQNAEAFGTVNINATGLTIDYPIPYSDEPLDKILILSGEHINNGRKLACIYLEQFIGEFLLGNE